MLKKCFVFLAMIAMLFSLGSMTTMAASVIDNPWTNTDLNLYVYEDFSTNFPQNKDINTLEGYWSWAGATQQKPCSASAKNGQLVIDAKGGAYDALFWGCTDTSLTADFMKNVIGLGLYVNAKNMSDEFGIQFYGFGKDPKADEGFLYTNMAYEGWLIDMNGKPKSTEVSFDGRIRVPAGFEGFVLFDLTQFVNGYKSTQAYTPGLVSLLNAGFMMGLDEEMKEGDTIVIDNFFAYGKNVPSKPANIALPKKPTTTSKPATPTSKPTTVASEVASEPTSEPEVSEASQLESQVEISSLEVTESTASVESEDASSTDINTDKPAKKGISPLVWAFVALGVVVLAAVVLLIVFKDKIFKKK